MNPEISRRGVLCGIAVLALGLIPENAQAAKGVKVLSSGKVEITLAANPALKKIGGVLRIDDVNGTSLALLRVKAGSAASSFKALNLSCTHQGVLVEQQGNTWFCPAHSSQFAINGSVKIGPAKSALATLPIKATSTKVTIG